MAVSTVLALRALGLGDALTGIPALRGLRRAYPDATLVLAAPSEPGRWLRRLGVVDDVRDTRGLSGSLPVTHPDVAVNLHGRGPESHRLLEATRPGRLVAFRNDAAGHLRGPLWPERSHEVDRWCRLVTSAGGPCGREDLRLHLETELHRTRVVVLHPGAASGSRRWPVSRWQDLARRLCTAGHQVVVSGGPREQQLCEQVVSGGDHNVRNLAGMLSLERLAVLIGSAGLLVCGDTGVAHLATAYATPSVLLFGPTPPSSWGPAIDPELHRVIWYGDEAEPGDPHGDEVDPALRRITVAEVLAAAEELLVHRLWD